MAYSRKLRKAFGLIKMIHKKETLEWNDHNHYLAKKLYINVGKDKFYAPFNGKVAYFKVSVGPESFSEKVTVEDDSFRY